MEKILETRSCTHCGVSFDISDIDADFLTRLTPTIAGKKYDLPFPTHCPKCRKIRRYAWRNEKNIYRRKCDATGKEIISLFSPDAPCPVYESDYWYSDKWDAHAYGRDYDFSRSFFEQWWELKQVVPMPGKAISQHMENSDYSDNCSWLKNCYLCFNAWYSEDCTYSVDIWNSKNCIDCLSILNCENCYELIDSKKCYNVAYSYDLSDCRDSWFLYWSDGCSECFGCFGLKNKKYYIFNIEYSENDFRKKLDELLSLSVEQQRKITYNFFEQHGYSMIPRDNVNTESVFNSTRVYNSKNIYSSFAIRDSEDIRYASNLLDARLVLDGEQWGDRLDRVYEWHQIGEASSDIYFTVCSWANISKVFYSAYLVGNIHNCFGCIGLRNAEYCILNKQYTKEEYEELVPKIIEKMQKTGEWGEFFPAKYSHFGYNQTMNMIKYPLTKEEAIKKGFTWSDYESFFPKVEKIIPASKLPDNISKIPDDILNWAIECEVTKKPFRIVKPELDFYRKHGLPIPKKHPDERYRERTRIYLNY